MLKNIIVIALFLMANSCAYAQSFEIFKKDFKNALEKDFSEESLNKMFRNYSTVLPPHSNIGHLMYDLQEQQVSEYPLKEFKEDSLYKNNISQLLFSTNRSQRILAYIVIAGAGDISYENELLRSMKEETDKGCLTWSAMALLHLKSNKTNELFDFLVENEDFEGSNMISPYLKLNKDSLQQTAYSKINSDKDLAKILAARILSVTELNDKTEELLKKAVREWSMDIKIYPIRAIRALKIGNLTETFKPLLDSCKIRCSALQTLADSPTKSDQDFVLSLTNTKDTLTEDLLNVFMRSENKENVKKWLELLYTKPIPKDYYLSLNDILYTFSDEELLNNKQLLDDLYYALGQIKEPKILSELLRVLASQNNDKSNEILIGFLSHSDFDVRYSAAKSLSRHTSDKLKEQLPQFIKNPLTNNAALTELAIENNLDGLQSFYENICNTDIPDELHNSFLLYIANFPLNRHKKMFYKILKNKEKDHSVKQIAALGLGKLKDKKATNLLIKVCEEQEDDFRRYTFLYTLAMIKNDKAKLEVEKYKDSSNPVIKNLVAELLGNW